MPYDRLIDPVSLAGLIGDEMVAIFDCSFDLAEPAAGRRQFREGHIPGARYLDLDRDLSGPTTGRNGRHPLPDRALFAAQLREAGVHEGQQVVAYDCSGGPYAARLWWLLRWIGHPSVAVLDGGFQAWLDQGLPREAGDVASPGMGSIAAGPVDPGLTVDADNVLARLGDPSRVIIDARSADRFAGRPHPFDPVTGHIPGARNRFFGDNLENGRFKSPAALHAAFVELLSSQDAAEIVLQCGSGVTACHNALAMAIAGIEGAKLYPGSWSEWIAEPSRPVAV